MSDAPTEGAIYRAALDLQAFCQEHGWLFCIIGGIAVQRWGFERFTKDADMTGLTRFDDEPVVDALLGAARERWSMRIG